MHGKITTEKENVEAFVMKLISDNASDFASKWIFTRK
jgi:hypothetical protein